MTCYAVLFIPIISEELGNTCVHLFEMVNVTIFHNNRKQENTT